ncbi:GTP-binding protein [Anaerotruncus sp. AF02-27]|uniref:translation factor GTPase family protein n=1 Tax=Anaerotruncus TaxID=244127 RepID=UPI000E4BB388|nr:MULTISPECIES: TetM/TetW/TetO/TetS family tetracycline resistance ribosomal protection protein [Anaerotruncus]RGX54291.1 GTP-binding protein [Anaerotruncus sp. AF02-27]
MKRLVIGILAHVDSGKTTLSEGLLYRAGEIRRLGRVDHGNAFLDTHELERERGITIFSKQAVLRLGETELTLLDTPGHVDFSAEMERTLQVLDYAILVVSGTDGVQSHAETLWQLLDRYRVPTFLFLNKMDLAGADRAALLATLRHRLGDGCIDFGADRDEAWQESVAMSDEGLMERFLEAGTLTGREIAAAVARRSVFPCYFGSALKLDGMDTFLSGLDQYTLGPEYSAGFGARVFKISVDEQGNRLTHLKVTGGSLKVKALLTGQDIKGESWSEKVNQIRIYSGSKYQTTEEAFPGMVCAVTGLSRTYPGEGLGVQADAKRPALRPVLTYQVQLPKGADAHTALGKLRQLEEEDPQLHVIWNEALQEIHVQIMGEVQLEVLRSLVRERFGLEIGFGQGGILYQETIARPVEGIGHFEPLRHYAEVHLLLEPGERGSGLQFASDCREDDLDRNWQRLILAHLAEKVHPGVLTGAPITDLKITLIAGRAHPKHTEGGDFRQATYRAVRQGLRNTESILLEPWYDFRLEVPSDAVGRAMSDLQRMSGEFSPPQTGGETAVLVGSGPVSEMRDYQMEVTSYTRGRGRLSCTLRGYEPCHNAAEVIAATGYDCDGDVDNPADSVFCAHGAGFLVKWDKVREYMHVQSGWGAGRPALEEPETEPVRRAADYCAMLAEDSELMKIFERTYGPIRRDPRQAFRPARQTLSAPRPGKAKAPPEGPEYLLVDGYNIIFAWEDLKVLAQENVDAARSRLIDLLCNYRGFRQCELILVFDAYKVKGNPGTVEKIHNINVVYTKEAETADMYIEKVTHELGRKYRVRVATSDALEQMIVLGHGALRISASAFREEVDLVEKTIRDFLDQARPAENT